MHDTIYVAISHRPPVSMSFASEIFRATTILERGIGWDLNLSKFLWFN